MMRYRTLILGGLLALCGGLSALPAAAVLIDDFSTTQGPLADPPGDAPTSVSGAGILGGQRDLAVVLVSGAGPVLVEVTGTGLDFLVTATAPDSRGEAVVTWDGDADPTTLDPVGLGGEDLTAGGVDGLRLTASAAAGDAEVIVTVYTDGANVSRIGRVVPGAGDVFFYFDDFVLIRGAGADFTDVGAVVLTVRGTEASLSLASFNSAASQADLSTSSKTAALQVDADSDSQADPGDDTIRYTVTLTNTGDDPALQVDVDDMLDPNLTLQGTPRTTPIAIDDFYDAHAGDQLTVSMGAGVLVNDLDLINDGTHPSCTPVNGVCANDGALPTSASGLVNLVDDGSLSYEPPPGFKGVDTVEYTVTDQDGNAATATATFVVENFPPVLAPGAFNAAFTEDGGPVPIAPTITVSDADDVELESATVTITNLQDIGEEVLAASVGGTGITANYVAPTLTLTGPDSLANFQTVLQSVTYDNSSQDPTPVPRLLEIVVDDGIDQGVANSTVSMMDVNDPPELAPDSFGASFTEDDGPVTVASTITISDEDDTDLASATVTITNSADGAAEVLAASVGGTSIMASYVAPTLTLTGNDTLANYQMVLQSLTYENTSQDPTELPSRSIDIIVNDGDDPSNSVTATTTVTAVNDAPTITVGNTLMFTEDDPATAIDPALLTDDVDGPDMTGATVQITGNFVPGEDVLSAIDQLGITSVYDGGTGTLTLSGVAPAADYQTVLRTVSYFNSDTIDPDNAVRTVTFTVSDTVAPPAMDTAMVQVIDFNEPPTADDETFTTVGNTEIVIHTASTHSLGRILYGNATDNVLDGDMDGEEGMPLTITALNADTTGPPFVDTSVLGGRVELLGNGGFTYSPPLGVKNRLGGSADSFTYTVSDGIDTATATVTIEILDALVWYVHNDPAGEPMNPDDAGNPNDGDSTNPLDTLKSVEALSGEGDFIFVFAGDGTTTGNDQGIDLKNGQKLIGHAANSLPVGAATLTLPPSGVKPKVDNVNVGGVGVRADNVTGAVVIRDLDVTGDAAAVEIDAGGAVTYSIVNNVINGGSTHGIDVAAVAGAALEIDLSDNVLAASGTANAANVSGVGGGTLVVTGFAGNSVPAGSTGNGVRVAGAVFDADTATGGIQAVAGDLTVGAAGVGNDVNGFGMVLNDVTGALQLNQLAVFHDVDTGLLLDNNAPLTPADFSLGIAGGGITTANGTALVVDNATFNATLANVMVTNGSGVGVSLTDTPGIKNFSGLSLAMSAGSGLIADTAGTIDLSATSSAINATGGSAIRMINTGLGGGATIFTTLNAANSGPGNPGVLFDGVGGGTVTVNSTTLNNIGTGGSPASGIDIRSSATNFNFTGGTITGVTGTAFNVGTGVNNSGGGNVITYGGSITNTAGRSVAIQERTGGSVTLSGNVSDTGLGILAMNNDNGGATTITFSGTSKVLNTGANTAVNLSNNDDATISFIGGGLDIDTSGTATAFTATGGGTVDVTGTGNSIKTDNSGGTGVALNVSSTDIGLNGLTFERVDVNGATNGIVLDSTGPAAGLTITGAGSAGSGGTIRNVVGADGATTGIGVRLNQTREVALHRMQLNDFSNFAIRGTTVTNFTLANTVIDGTNGTSAAQDEGSVSFDNLLGSATFTANTISGGLEDNIVVTNTTGVLDRMMVTGGTIGLNSTALGNDGILVEAQSSAVLNLTVAGTTFLGARGDHVQANALGTSTMDVVIRDNTFQNAHTNSLGGGVTISGGSAGSDIDLTYEVSGTTPGAQTFRDSVSNAITANIVNGTGTVSGTIQNNRIGVSGVAGSGSSAGNGISVGATGTVTHDVVIDNNSVVRIPNLAGIEVIANGSSVVNATVTQNSVDEVESFVLAGIYTLSGGGVGNTSALCVDIRNNTIDASASSGFDIYVDQISGSASYNFPGYAGPGNGGAALNTFLAGQNTLNGFGAESAAAQNVTGAGAGCPP